MHPSLRVAVSLLVLAGMVAPVIAQEEEAPPPVDVWQRDFEIGVHMLQSTVSDNWNGGDKGSLNWTGNFRMRLQKQYGESRNWLTRLRLAYGQTQTQDRNDDGTLSWTKPDKTDDIIEFESILRWTKPSGWDPFVALNFISMFDDRTDPEGRSQPLNPMTIAPSAGIAYKVIDTEKRKLLTRLGLAYARNYRKFFVAPAPSTETVGESSDELGVTWITEYEVGALDERVDWHSRLALVLPFIYSGKQVFEDDINPVDWGLPADVASYTTTLDVDWENTFTANITKVISVKLYVRWVYDKYDNTVAPVVDDSGDLINVAAVNQAIRKAGQFKQTLALGLVYAF